MSDARSNPTAVAPVPPVPPSTPSGRTTSTVTTTAEPVVQGDGTTAGSRARRRWRTARWPLAVLVLLILTGLGAAALRPQTSTTPYSPDSTGPDGARAVAQVLAAQGVEVELVRTTGEAVARADEGTTLLVIGTYLLTDEQVADLADVEADVVLAEAESWHLEQLTDGVLTSSYASDRGTQPAACSDEDAQAAGEITSSGMGVSAPSGGAVVCFSAPQDPTTGAYAVVLDEGRRIVALDDMRLLTNDLVDEDGNAALVLRTLGHHDRLVWYLPSYNDTGSAAVPSAGQLLPQWTGPLALQLLVVAFALALWRGRALGRVVTEPLPVAVRAAEATLGRGRLYRRSRSRGHAAAALRAGAARRAAARLGLPRSAGAPEVIDALARATGRSTEQVAGLLYGPPPTDDAGLLLLARALDELESEVHRT